jgi:protein-S-isoprenylcysteine O-methyltransferase Ste14
MKTVWLIARTIIYMAAFLAVFTWIALRLRTLDRYIAVRPPAWCSALGIVVGVLGLILVPGCAAVFVSRGRGTPAIFDSPRQCVAGGPDMYVRNPRYAGGLALWVGLGLHWRSICVRVVGVFLFVAAHLLVRFYEEPVLGAKFGATYDSYCRSVHRWLPRTPRAL